MGSGRSMRSHSAALFVESILRMGSGFLVAILLARQYGPEGLGLISTATSAVSLVLGFSALGLSGVLVRELVEKERERGTLLLSVTIIKLASGAILLVGLLAAISSLSENRQLVHLNTIIGLGFLFSSLDTFDSLYNAKRDFVRLVSLRLVALIASTGVKIVAIVLDLGLEIVAVGYALDFVLMYVLPATDYFIRRSGGQREDKLHYKWSSTQALALLSRSWPLLVSGGFAQINLKIDTLLIASMVGVDQVGIYSAAARLSEAWSVVAMALVTASFPALVQVARSNIESYAVQLERLLRVLLVLALAGAIIVSLLAGHIISTVYGEDFRPAAVVLAIHVFGGVFLFVRTAVSRWIIIEDLLKFSLVSHASGALINVVLNLILIPRIGIQGAAWSALASYFMSGILFLALTSKTRPMFFLILTALIPRRLKGGLTLSLVNDMVTLRTYKEKP
jgi:O-antigen/teichoic acid export membrane protein